MPKTKAAIVAVGTELTTGFVRDANVYYLAKELDALGIEVTTTTMLPDDRPLMREVFLEAMRCSQIVLVTGGLGPTEDDFTKEVLLDLFGGRWHEDAKTLERIKMLLERRNLPLTTINRQQAVVPSSAEVLPNTFGMAPATLYRYDGGILVSMPGVPAEMRGIFETELRPRLASFAGGIIHQQLYVFGVAESLLSARLRDWSSALPEGMALAYLPSMGNVCLRVSYNKELVGSSTVTECMQELYHLLEGEKLLHTDLSFPAYIVNTLTERKQTLSIAESCTGGLVSGKLTGVSGASRVYRGGVCTYTNAIKEQELSVPHEMLEKYSAVSAPVAEAMARGVQEKFGTTYGVATTGYMEMAGDANMTGEVYIGIATQQTVFAHHFVLNQNRQGNQEWSVERALVELMLVLLP
ncbi:MAG: CinA family nicotinamide mononucleotide deamidase-related protein [Bacteroides sp.]